MYINHHPKGSSLLHAHQTRRSLLPFLGLWLIIDIRLERVDHTEYQKWWTGRQRQQL